MQDFKNLNVWRKAHELALLTYRLTADFPRDEIFGLRHTMRKTAVDIPGYIAESCGKANNLESSRSISAAIALANRLEYYSFICHDLGMLKVDDQGPFLDRVVEVRKMLSGFNQRLAQAAI